MRPTPTPRLASCLALPGLASLLVIAGCAPAPAPQAPTVRPVRYERVSLREGAELRTFSGTARAALESNLSFKVSGTLIDLGVEVGERVAARQVIARLDPQDYAVRVQEAEAGLAQALAAQRNADAAYERTRGLYENRNASRSDLDAARANAESAAAQAGRARQQLEAARFQLSYTELRAPQDCTVAQTPVKENENVAAGQAVVRVNCGDCPEVVVGVPGTVITRIGEGDEVAVVIGALGERELAAVVTQVGIAPGQTGTTFPVTVALTHGCELVRSGMAADVAFRIGVDAAPDEISVPLVAVGEDGEGNFVFVLETDAEGRWFARRRGVLVGDVTPGGIAVRSGLDPGELVVTAGVSRIKSGQQVRLLER